MQHHDRTKPLHVFPSKCSAWILHLFLWMHISSESRTWILTRSLGLNNGKNHTFVTHVDHSELVYDITGSLCLQSSFKLIANDILLVSDITGSDVVHLGVNKLFCLFRRPFPVYVLFRLQQTLFCYSSTTSSSPSLNNLVVKHVCFDVKDILSVHNN